jgi:hypothetical protein
MMAAMANRNMDTSQISFEGKRSAADAASWKNSANCLRVCILEGDVRTAFPGPGGPEGAPAYENRQRLAEW